jgi:hypothetical protein
MRRLALLIAAAAAATAVLSACGTVGSGDPVSTAPNLSLPPTTVTRTGGVAGVNETLQIDTDGHWAYTNLRANAQSSGTLSDAQRRTLAQLAGSPDLVAEAQAPAPTGVCADAFKYAITVGATKLSFEDCGTAGTGAVKALVAAIVDATPL